MPITHANSSHRQVCQLTLLITFGLWPLCANKNHTVIGRDVVDVVQSIWAQWMVTTCPSNPCGSPKARDSRHVCSSIFNRLTWDSRNPLSKFMDTSYNSFCILGEPLNAVLFASNAYLKPLWLHRLFIKSWLEGPITLGFFKNYCQNPNLTSTQGWVWP